MRNIIKKILQESNDLEWIQDIPIDKTVTKDNWHVGMRVIIKPDSEFANQTKVPGTIIDHEDNGDQVECGDELCTWIWVKWDDRWDDSDMNRNNYRIGPIFDLDMYTRPRFTKGINESEDFGWMGDINPRPLNGIQFKSELDYEVRGDYIIYTIVDNGSKIVTITWENNRGGQSETNFKRDAVEKYLNNGTWVIVNTLKESDDLQWIKDVKTPTTLREITPYTEEFQIIDIDPMIKHYLINELDFDNDTFNRFLSYVYIVERGMDTDPWEQLIDHQTIDKFNIPEDDEVDNVRIKPLDVTIMDDDWLSFNIWLPVDYITVVKVDRNNS